MNAITIPMCAYRELLISDRSTELLADTVVHINGDGNVEICVDDERTEALLKVLGPAVLKIAKSPPVDDEAYCA
jgi:hypothetical protein